MPSGGVMVHDKMDDAKTKVVKIWVVRLTFDSVYFRVVARKA